MEAILDTKVDGAQEKLLVTAVETYLELNEDQEMKYAAKMAESPRKAEVERMELTWAGKWHEKGRQEGVELGRQEGVELARGMLIKILTQRFGQAPGGLVDRLRELDDPARLEAITDRVLTASSLAEVENLLGA